MPIRFVDASARLGRIQSVLEDASSAFSGTHQIPAGRTGTVGTQLEPYVAAFLGQFQSNASRIGSIGSTLSGANSAFLGTSVGPGALTAPSVAGAIATDNTIAISALPGESFGAQGPSIRVFDDGRGSTDGGLLTTSTAHYGAWSSFNSNPAFYDSAQSVSRGRSARVIVAANGYGNFGRGASISFAANQEIFYSNWWRATVATSQIEVGRSKPWWLMDGDDGNDVNTAYDMVIPTRGGGGWQFGGNDPVSSSYAFSVAEIQPANTWTRVSSWLKGSGTDCKLWCQKVNSLGQSVSAANKTADQFWDWTSAGRFSAVRQFTHLKFASYISPRSPSPTYDGWQDDRYVAVGPGAAARVEIGSHESYASCLDLRLCYITSWSASLIFANVDPDFSFSGKYIHVHDATNTHTRGGIGRLIS